MLPKIIRTGIHRYEGTGVRKTEMATQYRKAYVPVTLDVDKEGAILPRLIWWDNGVIFQIDQILYKCRATSKKVGGGGITDSLGKRKTKWISTGLTVKGNKKRAEAMLPSIRDEIENPNRDNAINQLETLARRGYFSIPTYEFKETYDNNGNPIWNCECRIAEEDYYFDGTSSSKKEAKKDSAFRMLFYVLGMEDE